MFEKDAEEYANGKGHEHYNYLFEENAGSPAAFANWCFKDGAEFGYNKANEWHFVKDGKYPKDENKICLLYLGKFNPITGWYKNGYWCFEDDRNENIWQDEVIAWKEIVFPELPKEKKKC